MVYHRIFKKNIKNIKATAFYMWGGMVLLGRGRGTSKDFIQRMGVLVEMSPRKQRTHKKMRVRKAGIVTKVYSRRRPFSYTERLIIDKPGKKANDLTIKRASPGLVFEQTIVDHG